MLTIVVQVDRPTGQAIGVKEDLAMYCEKFGDVKVVSITETERQIFGNQTTMFLD